MFATLEKVNPDTGYTRSFNSAAVKNTTVYIVDIVFSITSGSPIVGIVPSPSQVVPQCEEITTIHFFIQIFNV
jgi:hypothetical protein